MDDLLKDLLIDSVCWFSASQQFSFYSIIVSWNSFVSHSLRTTAIIVGASLHCLNSKLYSPEAASLLYKLLAITDCLARYCRHTQNNFHRHVFGTSRRSCWVLSFFGVEICRHMCRCKHNGRDEIDFFWWPTFRCSWMNDGYMRSISFPWKQKQLTCRMERHLNGNSQDEKEISCTGNLITFAHASSWISAIAKVQLRWWHR
jgi:hypothetical protein